MNRWQRYATAILVALVGAAALLYALAPHSPQKAQAPLRYHPAYVVSCTTPGHVSYHGSAAQALAWVKAAPRLRACWTIYYQPVPKGLH